MKTNYDECILLTKSFFDSLINKFDRLQIVFDPNNHFGGVDLCLVLPKQVGLDFDIHLDLQGDELHLSTFYNHAIWFPITDDKVRKEILQTVEGLIDGSYRIVEVLLNGAIYETHIQRKEQDKWETVYKQFIPFVLRGCLKINFQERRFSMILVMARKIQASELEVFIS